MHRYPPLFISIIVLLAACQVQPDTVWRLTAPAPTAPARPTIGAAPASPIPPRVTLLPVPTKAPTLPGASASSLTVSPLHPLPGDVLTVTWSLPDPSKLPGGHYYILVLATPGRDGPNSVKQWDHLPATGSLTIPLPMANRDRYIVFMAYPPDVDAEVRMPCPDPYFFDIPSASESWGKSVAQTDCAASAPVSYDAVDQVFEGGRMLAFDNQVFVFAADVNSAGRTTVLHADATTATTTDPLLVPAGKYPPDPATFERFWRGAHISNAAPWLTVREALGWAVAPAQAFQMILQRPWHTNLTYAADGTLRSVGKPDDISLYVRLSDGRAVFVSLYGGHGNRPSWGFVSP
jgi:hypothetical protein